MMNNRGHLPAGQPMQGGVADMGPGAGGGRRGGRPQPHGYPNNNTHHHYHHHSISQPLYPPTYMTPYGTGAPAYYVPPHYQNGTMAASPYLPYHAAGYNRSPPSAQHYLPMVPQTHHYSRPPQSPSIPAPYQVPPPPVHIPAPPHTPSSTHSQALQPPMVVPAPQTMASQPAPAEAAPQIEQQPQQQPPQSLATSVVDSATSHSPSVAPSKLSSSAAPVQQRFILKLPWLSDPSSPFPARAPRSRRRKRALHAGVAMGMPDGVQAQDLDIQLRDSVPLTLPQRSRPVEAQQPAEEPQAVDEEQAAEETQVEMSEGALASTPKLLLSKTLGDEASGFETPSTQDHNPGDASSTSPATPSSVQQSQPATSASITVAPTSVKPATRSAMPALPALPVLPALPKTGPKDVKTPSGASKTEPSAKNTDQPAPTEECPSVAESTVQEAVPEATPGATQPVKPKLWTGLFSKTATASANSGAQAANSLYTHTNGNSGAGDPSAGGLGQPSVASIGEAIQAYRVDLGGKQMFLEPRGLINTGNMCYMNSILQVLVFCVPFFDFLDQVKRKSSHGFKSESHLLDSMLLFMDEFKVIDSAASVEQLRKKLKNDVLEQYGHPFEPKLVYDALRKFDASRENKRFEHMKRGQQQDAEEFLGFLLDGLHEECAGAMRAVPASTASTAPNSSPSSPASSKAHDGTEDVWLEVGPRQRSAVTRSSGHSAIISPITRIFGGKLRSELRVHSKTSVTLEPFQPLQLDIGAPDVHNIVDALRSITRQETVDIQSAQGTNTKGIKQVFIESLPPVLILHLKRFQFETGPRGSTVKIWKKIGYPLELEIPKEVLSRHQRHTFTPENGGLPRYRLTAVVYHHGKNASIGHYTVDVRRQDGREWIRIDDTVIRRVRSEDVAEGGSEEDTAKSAQKDTANPSSSNRFAAMNDEEEDDDDGWRKATASNKKWTAAVNGSATKSNVKQHKENTKDNKVAYLLFYQRI